MAARYALQSFWYHNSSTGKDEYVHIGALRDTTHQSVISYAAMFGTSKLTSLAGQIDPKTEQYEALHPGGPGDGIT